MRVGTNPAAGAGHRVLLSPGLRGHYPGTWQSPAWLLPGSAGAGQTQPRNQKEVEQIFSSPGRKLSPSIAAIQGWEEHPPRNAGPAVFAEGISELPTAHPEPPSWYLLVSEIKLLLPLGHPLEGDPLLRARLCRAEIGGGSRMVPVGTRGKGTLAAPTRGTMSHPPQHRFGGDVGTHLCSSAATTKPQDASSVQTEEYKVLEGTWEQRGQGSSEQGHGGPPTSLSQPCSGAQVTERFPGRGRR